MSKYLRPNKTDHTFFKNKIKAVKYKKYKNKT